MSRSHQYPALHKKNKQQVGITCRKENLNYHKSWAYPTLLAKKITKTGHNLQLLWTSTGPGWQKQFSSVFREYQPKFLTLTHDHAPTCGCQIVLPIRKFCASQPSGGVSSLPGQSCLHYPLSYGESDDLSCSYLLPACLLFPLDNFINFSTLAISYLDISGHLLA